MNDLTVPISGTVILLGVLGFLLKRIYDNLSNIVLAKIKIWDEHLVSDLELHTRFEIKLTNLEEGQEKFERSLEKINDKLDRLIERR